MHVIVSIVVNVDNLQPNLVLGGEKGGKREKRRDRSVIQKKRCIEEYWCWTMGFIV